MALLRSRMSSTPFWQRCAGELVNYVSSFSCAVQWGPTMRNHGVPSMREVILS